MCNIDKAKELLKKVKSRTEKDLYLLEYGSLGFNSIDENNFHIVKALCERDNIPCPIYKSPEGIKFKYINDVTYNSLKHLASKYSLVFDIDNAILDTI